MALPQLLSAGLINGKDLLAAYYDRNPKQIISSYGGTINAAAGQTPLFDYTVPEKRLCIIENLYGRIRRTVTATTGGLALIQFQYYTNAFISTVLQEAYLNGNNLNDVFYSFYQGGGIVLLPGEQLLVEQSDDSTGGTCYYVMGVKATEFDA